MDPPGRQALAARRACLMSLAATCFPPYVETCAAIASSAPELRRNIRRLKVVASRRRRGRVVAAEMMRGSSTVTVATEVAFVPRVTRMRRSSPRLTSWSMCWDL